MSTENPQKSESSTAISAASATPAVSATPATPATPAPSTAPAAPATPAALATPATPAMVAVASATPATPTTPATPAPATITFEDFAKIDLRVATVLECVAHPNADKLLVLQIELAGGERRQICAGLRAHYPPEQLVGKQIIVVANLAPRMMRGQVSNGMLLAASDPATGKVIVMGPTDAVSAGSKVS